MSTINILAIEEINHWRDHTNPDAPNMVNITVVTDDTETPYRLLVMTREQARKLKNDLQSLMEFDAYFPEMRK